MEINHILYSTAAHHLVLPLLVAALHVKGCNHDSTSAYPRHERQHNRRRTYILVTAIQYRLVAPSALADPRERIDDAQPNLLSLRSRVHGDVFDVPDFAEPAQKLAFNEDAPDADDAVRSAVEHNQRIVRVWRGLLLAELIDPRFFAWVNDDGERGQYGKMTPRVVG